MVKQLYQYSYTANSVTGKTVDQGSFIMMRHVCTDSWSHLISQRSTLQTSPSMKYGRGTAVQLYYAQYSYIIGIDTDLRKEYSIHVEPLGLSSSVSLVPRDLFRKFKSTRVQTKQVNSTAVQFRPSGIVIFSPTKFSTRAIRRHRVLFDEF